MTSTGSPRFRAAALLVLVAGFGFATGFITDRVLVARTVQVSDAAEERVAPDRPMRVTRDGGLAVRSPGGVRVLYPSGPPGWLTEELDLTPDQHAAFERVLTESQEAYRVAFARIEPELTEVIERARLRILEVLTEEQVERWETLSEQRTRRIFRP